jgi:hypothetical protein
LGLQVGCTVRPFPHIQLRQQMPIPRQTPLAALPSLLPDAVNAYNHPGTRTANYNVTYAAYIDARSAGIAANGNLAAWIQNGNAAMLIHALLASFGMNAQGSVLVASPVIQQTLTNLSAATINWIQGISLPLHNAPSHISNPLTHRNLSAELQVLFNALSAPGAVTLSGGFVAASKTLHCLFPGLAPMIDGRHSGLSYFHIDRVTYKPPSGFQTWYAWLGEPFSGIPNPSPRGAGRVSWNSARFIAALGINQHIYEIWQANNHNLGMTAFLSLDPVAGTTGVPRIIDKLLW